MNKSIYPLFFFLSMLVVGGNAQPALTIDSCYTLARSQYPLIRQRDLIDQSTAYTLENASRGYWPQININGQASYQSDVTKLPINAPGIRQLSKDQYKIYAEINQPVFEGGVIRRQQQIQRAGAVAEQQKVELELYKLRERVNQVFFGILLIDEQLRQNELVQQDIQNGLRKTRAAFENGTAFRSNVDLLQAESLKINQRAIELKATRTAYAEMLGMLTGLTIGADTRLAQPSTPVLGAEITRPELQLFDAQRNALSAQMGLLKAKNMPKLNFFLQGGWGRPAFNILSNDFEPYYIGGFRLNVPLTGFYTLKNERKLVEINRKGLDVQQEVFLFNTRLALRQQNAEISKLQELIGVDDAIIALRQSVKNSASAQLENGVITSSDYLREVNAEDSARQNKILHQIQLLLSQYAWVNTTGSRQ